jgi:D-alanine-D-alanine ligase
VWLVWLCVAAVEDPAGGVELVDADSVRDLVRSSPLYQAGALAEPYLKGWYDVNIAVRSWPELQLSPSSARSGAPGRCCRSRQVRAREGMAGAPRELPAALAPEVAAAVVAQASVIAEAAAVRGVARLDFMTDGASVLVNEINTIPGSLARYLWIAPEIPFIRQLTDLADEAAAKPAYRPVLTGADGRLLRGAASVAAKLA